MQRRTEAGLVLSCVAFFIACGSNDRSAGSDNGQAALPPWPTLLRDLTEAEAQSLCMWQDERVGRGDCLQNAIIAAGFTAQISADPATVKRAREICETEIEHCLAPDEVAFSILNCVTDTRDNFQHCDVSVGDVEACIADLAADFGRFPSCDALTEDGFRSVLYDMGPASCSNPQCKP